MPGEAWFMGLVKPVLAIGVLIMLIVIIIKPGSTVFAGTKDLVDRTAEGWGLDIFFIPKLLAATVSLDEKSSPPKIVVHWTPNKDADKYCKSPSDKECVDEVNMIHHYKQFPSQQDFIEKGSPNLESMEKAQHERVYQFETGLHRFTIQLISRGADGVERKVEQGYYTEEYVELLDKPIPGCNDKDFAECNVIECKKKRINGQLMDMFSGGKTSRQFQDTISAMLSDLRGDDCVDVSNLDFDFSLCDNIEDDAGNKLVDVKKVIDDTNVKFARARMLHYAHMQTTNGLYGRVSTENDYANYPDLLDDFKTEAKRQTFECTAGTASVRTGVFKGAYAFLSSAPLNWKGVPNSLPINIWDKRVNDVLDKTLANVRPGISNVNAEVTNDKAIALSWSIPFGQLAFDRVEVKHYHKRWDNKESAENQRVLQSQREVLPTEPLPLTTEPNQATGRHEFEMLVFGKEESEPLKATVATGLFDKSYLELYRGDVEDKCGRECNVFQAKIDALLYSRSQFSQLRLSKLLAAYQKATIKDRKVCKYERGRTSDEALSTNCKTEEIDSVYLHYLREVLGNEQAVKDIYNCVDGAYASLSSEQKSMLDIVPKVCSTKNNLANTLAAMGWRDFTS